MSHDAPTLKVPPGLDRIHHGQLRARSPSPFKPFRSRRRSLPNGSSALDHSLLRSDAAPFLSEKPYEYTLTDSDEEDERRPRTSGDSMPKFTDGFDEKLADLEAGRQSRDRRTHAAEYLVSTDTKLLYLAVYFGLNLALTIYNKAVLGGFHFPWLLTAIHAGFVSVGCYALLLSNYFKLTKLNRQENTILVAFSFLFTINIAISNVSLDAVSVPFHQIMRSTCPIFAVLIYRFYFNRSYSFATYISIIPIIFGVGLATFGDYYFTLVGFLLTLLGVVLAAVKTVVTNRLMTGSLALPALEVLLRMSPLAAAQALSYAYMSGEASRFVVFVQEGNMPWSKVLALVGNGLLAYVLNISSFQTNKLAGALTLTVAGNLKQCLTILLGIVLFQVRVSVPNGIGMFITVLGAAWYSKVELDSKGKQGPKA